MPHEDVVIIKAGCAVYFTFCFLNPTLVEEPLVKSFLFHWWWTWLFVICYASYT